MASLLRAAARTGLVGGVALLVAASTATFANAESGELDYSCDFGIEMGEEPGPEGSGDTTARFDSGITDGLVVATGARVGLDPFTGSIALPDDFLAMVRDEGIEEIEGGGVTFMAVDESGEEVVVEMSFPATAVPESGPLTLALTGDDVPSVVAESGTNTLQAGDVLVGFGDEDYSAGMFCELVDEGDIAIDAFEATGSAAPTATVSVTTTATTTAAPVRPVVVQTDFAGDQPSSAQPLLAGGVLAAAAAGALAVRRGARRAATRRH